MRRLIASVLCVATLTACASDGQDTTSGSWSAYRPMISTTPFGRGAPLDGLVDLVERDAGDGFFYLVSRRGVIERWSNDGSERTTALDVSSLTTTDNERGLLGLAFRRERDGTWTAFLHRTDLDGNTAIDALDMTDDGDFVIDSRRTILSVPQPYANHNGGSLAIAPDNTLLIGLGDGGSGGDPERRSQRTDTLLGKILRIDPTATGYDIPADNPYVGIKGSLPEIWSIGLRNPWRFTISDAGDLWIADVGQNTWEELDVARHSSTSIGGRGANFGWSAFEGSHVMNGDQQAPDVIAPVHEYRHGDNGCSISGAALTTTVNLPGWENLFLFGDYCAGWVKGIDTNNPSTSNVETLATGLKAVTAIRSTHDGVFALTMSDGLFRLTSSQE